MIDHATLHVKNFAKAKEFFSKALAPIGYALMADFPEWSVAGFGAGGKADLWLHAHEAPQPSHIAFVGKSKKEVEAFYKAAIAAGGRDNGKPEYVKEYSPGYYGAFVFDPDGNNIEVVFHDPSITS